MKTPKDFIDDLMKAAEPCARRAIAVLTNEERKLWQFVFAEDETKEELLNLAKEELFNLARAGGLVVGMMDFISFIDETGQKLLTAQHVMFDWDDEPAVKRAFDALIADLEAHYAKLRIGNPNNN